MRLRKLRRGAAQESLRHHREPIRLWLTRRIRRRFTSSNNRRSRALRRWIRCQQEQAPRREEAYQILIRMWYGPTRVLTTPQDQHSPLVLADPKTVKGKTVLSEEEKLPSSRSLQGPPYLVHQLSTTGNWATSPNRTWLDTKESVTTLEDKNLSVKQPQWA